MERDHQHRQETQRRLARLHHYRAQRQGQLVKERDGGTTGTAFDGLIVVLCAAAAGGLIGWKLFGAVFGGAR